MNYAYKAITQKLTQCYGVCLTLLLLTSCSTPQSQPSVHQTPTGNAWALTLPKGTQVVTNPETLKQLRALAINEIGEDDVFVDDVILVNPAYLIERDEREFKLIEQLELKKIQ